MTKTAKVVRVARRKIKVKKITKSKRVKESPAMTPTHVTAKVEKKPAMKEEAAGSDVAQFNIALRQPFSSGAIGARVIDSYVIPTATYHVRSAFPLVTTSQGVGAVAFLPSPCFSFVVPAANTTNGGFLFNPGPYTGFSQNGQTTSIPGGGYLISPTALNSVLTEYRTVSWGIRIIAKDTAFASKGKVYIATVPTTENNPSWNTMETVTGTDTSIGEYTIGMPLTSISGIMNLPGVRVMSMQDLLRGDFQVIGTPTHSSFYQFKGTADRSNTPWSATQTLADEAVFTNASGALVSTAGGRKDVASLRGGRAVLIYMTGGPASTNEIDIEVIYHLEGTPNIAATGSSAQIIPSAMRPVAGSTSLVERAISIASKANVVFQFLRDPSNQSAAMRAVRFFTG